VFVNVITFFLSLAYAIELLALLFLSRYIPELKFENNFFLNVTSALCFTNIICIVYVWQSKHN